MDDKGRVSKLLIGLGSPHGDDQVGWRIVETISRWDPELPTATLATPIEILDRSAATDRLVICDACCCGQAPGSVSQWRWPSRELQPFAFAGTHDLGLPAVLELAAELDLLPADVTIWGIAIDPVRTDIHLSPALERALPCIARPIHRDLRRT